MIYRDRDLIENGITPLLLEKCITQHQLEMHRYAKLKRYYDGEHDIKKRTFTNDSLPNNKLVCNHASYITDMAVSYVFGEPISYTGKDTEKLNEIFTQIDEDSHNNELALDVSIFGRGFELVYMSDEETPTPKLAVLNPNSTFVVADTSVEHKPMFAVTYQVKKDINDTITGYDVFVYTDKEKIHYRTSDISAAVNITETDLIETKEYYFDDIPIIEYKNNKDETGDFEKVIPLIDAYNLLQSDRVNDKEQLVDAFLVVIGQGLGDTDDEVTKTVNKLKEEKIIELDEGGDAKWLVKSLSEDQVEILKKAIKDDIHEFSKVPCLTDENFVGNSSGVAMKYKLLGLENLGKTKERYFKQGLRQRLKLMSNVKNKQAIKLDINAIDIKFKRCLPVDNELLARIAQETDGFLSWETRVKEYNPEIDVEEEKKRLEEEKKKNIEQQQQAFGSYDFKNGDDTDVNNTNDNSNSDSSNKNDTNRGQADKN